MATRIFSEGQGDDRVIRGHNLGGLNTVATPLNMAKSDSPRLVNCSITKGGLIQKRKGTYNMGTLPQGEGVGTTGHTSTLGYEYLVSKSGTDVLIGEVRNSNYSTLMTKENVFTARAEEIVPRFVQLPDNLGRTVILTGTNTPVQVSFLEQRLVAKAVATEIEFTSDAYANASALNTLVYLNNEPIAGLVSVVENAVTVTMPMGVSLAIGDTLDVVFITWQWWTEAYAYFGDRFYDVVPRFKVDESDRHLEVPEKLRDGIQKTPAQTGYPMRVRGTAAEFYFQPYVEGNPGRYAFTDGSASYSEETAPQITPNFITFGDHDWSTVVWINATASSQGAVPVHLYRHRPIRFTGNQGWDAADVVVSQVFNKTSLLRNTVSTTAVGSDYGYESILSNGLTPQGTSCFFLSPGLGQEGLGFPLDDIIRIHVKGTDFIGAGQSPSFDIRDGGVWPVYGFGEFADFFQGMFPTAGAFIGNRIVLGGVPTDPLRLMFSAVSDTHVPGEFYNSVQIDPFNSSSGAFDFQLSASSDDFIMGMVEWQGSVFVFTKNSTYRLKPGEGGTYQEQYVGEVGMVQPTAYMKSKDRVLFVADTGVWELRPSDGLSDSYYLDEVSIKVSDRFVDAFDASVIALDGVEDKLYITTSNTEALTFHTRIGAWADFRLYGDYTIKALAPYVDQDTKLHGFMFIVDDGTDLVLLKTEYDYYTDWSTTEESPTFPSESNTTTTVEGVRFYEMGVWSTMIDQVEDIKVTLDGDVLVFKKDYYKKGPYVYLYERPAAGLSLTVVPKNPDTQDGTYEVEHVIEGTTGVTYLSLYATPVFTWGQLANYKRMKHFILMLNNQVDNAVFDLSNIGDAEPEEYVGTDRVKFDANITYVFNNERGGETSYDLYGLYGLVWDYSLFDNSGTHIDDGDYVVLRAPVQGMGVTFQALLWNSSSSTFSLAGYAMDGNLKGSRYRPE